MATITLQSLVSSALTTGDKFLNDIVTLQAHPQMAKAIKGGRESVASLLMPLVAAHYKIGLVEGQRGMGFAKEDETKYNTAKSRHLRLVRAVFGHSISVKETKAFRMTETRRQYVAKIGKAIAGLSKIDAKKLFAIALSEMAE